MGQQSEFACPSCGYSALVEGGKGYGFIAEVETMDCKELVDVLVGLHSDMWKPEDEKDIGRCPNCNGNNVVVWDTASKPCPRCGGMMEKTGRQGPLWD